MSLAPPCTSALGVSDLQHFGERLDSSELSFLRGGLGYLSLLRAPCLWSHFFPWWGLSPGGGRARVGHEKVSSGASPRGTSLGGGTVSRPWGSQAGVSARGEGETVSPPVIGVGRGAVSLSCVGGWGGGGSGASGVHTGVVFLLVSATSHRLAPPGKGPAPPQPPAPSLALRAQSR